MRDPSASCGDGGISQAPSIIVNKAILLNDSTNITQISQSAKFADNNYITSHVSKQHWPHYNVKGLLVAHVTVC